MFSSLCLKGPHPSSPYIQQREDSYLQHKWVWSGKGHTFFAAASLLPAALSSALEEMGTAYREGTELQRNSDLKALGVYEVQSLP